MTSSIYGFITLSVVALISQTTCRSLDLLLDGDFNNGLASFDGSSKWSRLPLEFLAAFDLDPHQAQGQHLAEAPEAPLMEAMKRSRGPSPRRLRSYLRRAAGLRGMKRKMFWQPLGYMPASARAHNNVPEVVSENSQDSGTNVFRYG